jgi:hypothetical protein
MAATAQDHAWMRAADPHEGAMLVLGGAEGTEDVLSMLACQPGAGFVDVTVVEREGDSVVIQMRAGRDCNRYPSAVRMDERNPDVVDIQLKMAAIDPALQSFADTGQMMVAYASPRG